MNTNKMSLSLLLAAVCASACTVPFASEDELELRFELGELDGDCQGSGERTNENGTVGYSYGNDGQSCTINLTWNGVVLDAEALRDTVEEEVRAGGLDPAQVDVNLKTAAFEVIDLALRDAAGNELEPRTVESIDASLALDGGANIFVIQGRNVAFDETSVDMANADDLIEELQAAYDEGRTARGVGQAVVTIPLPLIEQLRGADTPAIEFRLGAIIEAEGGVNLFAR